MGLGGDQENWAPSNSSMDHMLDIVKQYTNQTFWFPTSTVIALVISYCIIIVSGLVGNILVIVVICKKKSLRGSRNMYILNLSVCDVVMCSICMPFSLAKLSLKKWTLGLTMCRTMPALASIDVFVSTLTIVAIAVDRYLSIVHLSQVTTRQVVIVLLAIWVVAILLSTPLFCFHKIDTLKMYEHTFVQQCIDAWPSERFREVYTTAAMLIQYLTPTSVISYLHGRICRFLQTRHEERPGFESQMAEKTRNDLRRHRTNMVLLTAVALVFSLTWLPLTILNIAADLAHEIFQESQYNLIHAISLLVAMSSSAINPIIYGWFNSNFRSAFMEILGLSSGEKSVDTIEKSKTKLAPPSIAKNRSTSGSNKSWRKSPRASPKVGHELARPASFSSSSTGKGAVWTHAQYVVEHVEGSPVLRRNNVSLPKHLAKMSSVDRIQPLNETGCFLSKHHRGSLISYDSIGHREQKGSPSSYDTCSASERKDKKSPSFSRSTSCCKDKKESSSSYESCSVVYKDRKDKSTFNASEYTESECKSKKESSSSYETCTGSVFGRNDPAGSLSSYDTCSSNMPSRRDLKSSCSSFDSLFSRKDKGNVFS